jgi:hypothetical protein
MTDRTELETLTSECTDALIRYIEEAQSAASEGRSHTRVEARPISDFFPVGSNFHQIASRVSELAAKHDPSLESRAELSAHPAVIYGQCVVAPRLVGRLFARRCSRM